MSLRIRADQLFNDYGMLIVLALLCLLFTLLTISPQHYSGAAAAEAVMEEQQSRFDGEDIFIIALDNRDDVQFAQNLSNALTQSDAGSVVVITGDPLAIRTKLDSLLATNPPPSLIVTTNSSIATVSMIKRQFENLESTEIVVPSSYLWPTFLLTDNIRNVANQITVIAIIAIGMTMVIITAGIDLSVGSLIALSAVVAAWLAGRLGGAEASMAAMVLAASGGILLAGAIGAFSGLMVTTFRIPPFIATLAMMQVAAGLAYIVSEGKPIYRIPEEFVWLGRGTDPWLHVPIAVWLMALLYGAAHLIMSRTTFGRYVYAVGGNAEAARLSGIRVNFVLLSVYSLCGLLAGLGGIIMSSQLKSGAPTYGLTYELYVIAAVVVGGTSLMGGEGRILGTLIGAFIIAVIQNGMNLTNVESYTQKVILGLVILGAVLLDRLKQRRSRIKVTQLSDTT